MQISSLAAVPCLYTDQVSMKCYRVPAVAVALALTSSAQQPPKSAAPAAKPAVNSQLYRNAAFGFRYQVPYGWVDRAEEMKATDTGKGASAKSAVLLAVFEHPPQAASDSVNSAVVIASESVSSYPGLKTAEDYIAPLDEVTAAQGFKPAGEAAAVEIDGRPLLRADFSRPLNDKLTMLQTTFVLLAKGQIVSFTFIAGSQDEIDALADKLTFDPVRARPR